MADDITDYIKEPTSGRSSTFGMETPVLVAQLRSRTGVLVCASGSEPPSSEHVGGGDHDCKDPERSQEPIR
jgi:hypothetical protein